MPDNFLFYLDSSVQLLLLSLARVNECLNEVQRPRGMPGGLSSLSQKNLLLASVSSNERLCSFAKLESTRTYLIRETQRNVCVCTVLNERKFVLKRVPQCVVTHSAN